MANVLENSNYAHVRGFNYQPSYASHGLEIWGAKFDTAAIEKELGRGKTHFPGLNTIRIWLSHDAFIQDSDGFVKNFETVLDMGQKYGFKYIVTLFNGWRSIPDLGGISFEQINGCHGQSFDFYKTYLEKIVASHAADEKVLLWDLCNEPFSSTSLLSGQSQNAIRVWRVWLDNVYRACKDFGAKAPICVGSIPEMESVQLLEPISDVLTFHPYYAWNAWMPKKEDFCRFLDEAVVFANRVGKAAIATETCWGNMDDKARAETGRFELSELRKRGIGFTAHLLHETRVADGHRLQYGPITNAGYMAFVQMDGTLRPYHDFFNEFGSTPQKLVRTVREIPFRAPKTRISSLQSNKPLPKTLLDQSHE